jgi:hypothetical protein
MSVDPDTLQELGVKLLKEIGMFEPPPVAVKLPDCPNVSEPG